jgi:hypothetical protein
MELDTFIREGGFDPATVTEPQRKTLTAAWKQAHAPKGEVIEAGGKLPVARVLLDGDGYESEMATIQAETARRNDIKAATVVSAVARQRTQDRATEVPV